MSTRAASSTPWRRLAPLPGASPRSHPLSGIVTPVSTEASLMHRPTTRSAFVAFALTMAMAASSAAQTITSPKQFFGFNIGADYQLATHTRFVEYWQKLDKESDMSLPNWRRILEKASASS